MKKLLFVLPVFFLWFPSVSHAAILFDNYLPLQSTTGTTLSYPYTTSGSDRILIVRTISLDDHITGVTYDGVAMTRATSGVNIADKDFTQSFYYLKDPTLGTNNVVITTDSPVYFGGTTVSYDGAEQSGGVDVAIPHYGSAMEVGDITTSVDVTRPNSWLVESQDSPLANPSSVVNGTTHGSIDQSIADSNGGVGVGNQIIGYRWDNNDEPSIIALAFAPADAVVPPPSPSSTPNRLAKFTSATQTLGDSLFSDNGSNMTLTSGNLFMQVGSMIDTITNGALNFGTSNATTMTFGRSGQNMIINSKVGIGTTDPAAALDVRGGIVASMLNILGSLTFGAAKTATNCHSSASPAACGSAAAGSVAFPNKINSHNYVVNTTAVTPNSQILITEDSSLGSRLGITCDTTTGRVYTVSARTPGVGFTITTTSNPANNKACLSYLVIN